MTRNYLIHIRFTVAVRAAIAPTCALNDDEDAVEDALWDLLPEAVEDVVDIDYSGDSYLCVMASTQSAVELLSAIKSNTKQLPVDVINVLEVGSKWCVLEQGGDTEPSRGEAWTEVPLTQWVGGAAIANENRPTFGPKAILLVTDGREVRHASVLPQLRRALPNAHPHWHGRTSQLLALSSDHGVGAIWGQTAVQKALNADGATFVGCFEIGPSEAASDPLATVLPGCVRQAVAKANPGTKRQTRTVQVEYARPRLLRTSAAVSGGAAAAKGVTLRPLAANDDQRGANDNCSRQIQVPVRTKGGKPKR